MTASISPHPPPSVYSVSICPSTPSSNGFLTSLQNKVLLKHNCSNKAALTSSLTKVYVISFSCCTQTGRSSFLWDLSLWFPKNDSYVKVIYWDCQCVFTLQIKLKAEPLVDDTAFILQLERFSWGFAEKLHTFCSYCYAVGFLKLHFYVFLSEITYIKPKFLFIAYHSYSAFFHILI